jgi:hypothetical protein
MTGAAGGHWDVEVAVVVTREGTILAWSEQPAGTAS